MLSILSDIFASKSLLNLAATCGLFPPVTKPATISPFCTIEGNIKSHSSWLSTTFTGIPFSLHNLAASLSTSSPAAAITKSTFSISCGVNILLSILILSQACTTASMSETIDGATTLIFTPKPFSLLIFLAATLPPPITRHFSPSISLKNGK